MVITLLHLMVKPLRLNIRNTRLRRRNMKFNGIKKYLYMLIGFTSLLFFSCGDIIDNLSKTYLCEDDIYLAEHYTSVKEANSYNAIYSSGLAYATSTEIVDNVTYHYASVSVGTCTDTVITVPDTYTADGVNYTVNAVSNSGFAYSSALGYDYIRTITSVTLPDTVSIIGSQAFKGSGLTSFTLPVLVTTLNPSIFMDCRSLANFTFGSTVVSNVTTYAIRTIGDNCFEGDLSLGTLSLPNAITSIGNSAFKDCSSIPSIILPNSLTSLGVYAFEYCTNAKIIYLNSGITTWGDYAFKGCSSVTYIYLSGDYPTLSPTSPTSASPNGNWNYKTYNSYIPFSVSAGIMDYDNGFYFTYDDSVTPATCVIYKYDGTNSDVVIPALLKNRRVVGIAESAFKPNSDLLTSIQIGEVINGVSTSYVTYVGNNAFQNCNKVTKIDLSNAIALTTIGNYSFSINSALDATTDASNIVIPSKVETIGEYAFFNLHGYSRIKFMGALATDTENGVVVTSHLTSIGQYAFQTNNQGNYDYISRNFDLVFPSNLTSIGKASFAWQFGVTSIKFTNTSAMSIGEWAFSRAFSCTSITFSSSAATTLGKQCFEYFGGEGGSTNYYNHETISLIYIPSNVTISDSSAFDNCARAAIYREATGSATGISSVTKSNSAYFSTSNVPQYWNVSPTILSNYGVGSDMATTSPSTTQNTIVRYNSGSGYFDFLTNTSNTNLILTRFVFKATNATTDTAPVVPSTITINGTTYTVKTIGISSFYGSYNTTSAYSLNTVQIPTTITTIGNYAFANNPYLINVTSLSSDTTYTGTMPTGLTSIGQYALASNAISSVIFQSALTTFGNNNYVTPFGENKNLATIVLPSSNTKFYTSNNVIYKISGTNNYDTLVYIPQALSGSLTVNDACLTIYQNASYYNTSLTSVVLDRALTSIGNYAFRNNTAITSVSYATTGTYASSVTIGQNAFYQCSNLSSFTYSPNLTSIGQNAFQNDVVLTNGDLSSCTSLTSIGANAYYNCNSLTSIIIPTSVTSIGANCYQNAGNNSSSVTLNLGALTEIPGNAFNTCKKISSITIPSSVLSIQTNAFKNCSGATSLSFGSVVGADNFSSNVTIAMGAFNGMSGFSSLVLPRGVNFSSLTTLNNTNLPFYHCTSLYNGSGIFLCDTEILYVGDNAAHFPSGWNFLNYTSSSHTAIPFYFYAASTSDVATTGHITGAQY